MWQSASISVIFVFVTCSWLWSIGFPTRVVTARWEVNVIQQPTTKSADNVGDQSQRAVGKKATVSKYMLDLYRRYSEDRTSGGGSRAVADIVRSLTPRKIGSLRPLRDGYLLPANEMRHILEFDIPMTRMGETLEEAELRLYIVDEENPRSSRDRTIRVSTLVDQDSDSLQRHVIQQSSSRQDAWMTFNVTSALSERRKRRTTLRLVTHVAGDDVDMEGEIQPLLLLSYSTAKPRVPEERARGRRSVQAEDYEEQSNSLWDDDLVTSPRTSSSNSAMRRARRLRNTCRRRPLYVDFAEIHYDTWIVAPSGYEAFQCLGKCFFPVSEHLSPTKHAIVQTLIHSVAPGKVARACCVPTRLEPISVLYVDQSGVLTYRFSYQDMVVAECGCR